MSSPERASRALATFIETQTNDDTDVILVGYSLGGLIARNMLTMAFKGQIQPDHLLRRIKAVVTLGTPLDGARLRYLIRLGFAMPWLNFIRDQGSNRRIPFREATRGRRDTEVPPFYHIQFERDAWVREHIENNYTEFDNPAGTMPGGHTNFLDDGRARIISTYLTTVILRARAYARTFADANDRDARQEAQPPQERETRFTCIILISCSNNKETQGGFSYQPPAPAQWLSDRRLSDQLLEKRASILDKLKTHRVVDQKFFQGNRGDRPENQALVRGPDFGIQGEAAVYLPAISRYRGRLYGPSRDIDWDEFHNRERRPLVLIMSALYGLVQSNEYIQNYDAGISDVDLSSSTPLRGLWTDWMTESVDRAAAQIGGKVRIFNLMADLDYTSAIRWSALKRENCSVFHLMSDRYRDIDLLTPAGIVFAGMVRQPDLIDALERTTAEEENVLPLSRFGDVPAPYEGTWVGFERAIGEVSEGFDWDAAKH
jgi:cytoplasmic iron level regulating protein YaaA (DUF328/UPF0246 family)